MSRHHSFLSDLGRQGGNFAAHNQIWENVHSQIHQDTAHRDAGTANWQQPDRSLAKNSKFLDMAPIQEVVNETKRADQVPDHPAV